jgi:hypothetical protein
MFFDIDGKRYGVKFSRNGTTTYAELVKVQEWGLDYPGLVGIATLHPRDRFVKKTGRKVALAGLLYRMNEVSAGDTEPEFNLTKEDRAKIWEEYFRSHKK